MFAKSNQVERNHTPHQQLKHKAMKKTIIILALAVIALAAKNHQQNQVINNLSNQVVMQQQVFEKVLDQVEEDRPSYVLDVLTETDAYADYIDLVYNY